MTLKNSWTRNLLMYSPIFLAILIMLPRLLSPQFGLLDDGRMLVTSDRIAHGVWDMSKDEADGRFRPMYWISFTITYMLFGATPIWFFVGNMLVLIVTVAGLIFLVHRLSSNKFLSWASGLLFVLSGPVVESFFTLSKGEPLQGMFMVLSLASLVSYPRIRDGSKRVGLVLLSSFLLLLAHFSKETSVVILAISLVWYLAPRLRPHAMIERQGLALRMAYLVSSVISVVVYFMLHSYFVPGRITSGHYTNNYHLETGQLITSLIRWLGWLIRDYIYLLPLLIAFLLSLWAFRRLFYGKLLFESMVWMMAWMGVFLPWYFMTEYYMFPFALGAAVFGATLLDMAVECVRKSGFWISWMARVLVGLAILLLAATQLNNVSNGRLQLTVDKANAELLDFLRAVPPKSVVWVNLQDPSEYYYRLLDYMNTFWGRSDLVILPFSFQEINAPGDYYIIAPYIVNQPLLAVRLGVFEPTQNKWNESLLPYFEQHPGWQQIAQFEYSFRMSGVDFPRLFCPLITTRSFCETPAPFIDTRIFTYGWRVYKLEVP